jgi:hypothetical protein
MISTKARLGVLVLLVIIFRLTTGLETEFAATNPFNPAPGSPISVGVANTGFVAVGDLNGDGKPDMVVTSVTGNSVSVMLGTGGGAFGPPVKYAVGLSPLEIAIGDLNGDGKPDLVVTNQVDGTLSILLNAGAGAFNPAQTLTLGLGTAPEGVAIADLNGDGRKDIIVVLGGTGSVAVLLNSALGFTTATTYPVGNMPSFVSAVDLNGDGALDLAVSNNTDNSVSILINNGNGTFKPKTDIPLNGGAVPCVDPDALTAADFNQDGKQDLAVICSDSSSVAILIGNGAGTFATPVVVSSGPTSSGESIVAADFDNKNGIDIAWADSKNNLVGILLNNGSGVFSSNFNDIACQPTGGNPFTLAVADFDNDSKPDIAVANEFDGTVSVLLNAGNIALGAGTCPWASGGGGGGGGGGNFTVQLTPSTVTTKAGTLVTYTVTVTPGTGFAGVVNLTCTSPAPNSGCSLSPTSVNLQNGAAATSTLSVATNFSSSGSAFGRADPAPELPPQNKPLYAMLSFGALGMVGLALSNRSTNSRPRRLAAVIIATLGIVMLLIVSQACSSGKGGFPDVSHKTPAGTYNVTVTGSITVNKQAQTASGNAQLIVQ